MLILFQFLPALDARWRAGRALLVGNIAAAEAPTDDEQEGGRVYQIQSAGKSSSQVTNIQRLVYLFNRQNHPLILAFLPIPHTVKAEAGGY